MTATYDPTNLDKGTASGRVNVVRFLLGDTDVTNPELQNEEITFTLSETTNKVYLAASICASTVASKYSGLANVEINGILSVDYSELANAFSVLSVKLKSDGNRLEGGSIGVFVGGLPVFPARSYSFFRGQFQNPNELDDLNGRNDLDDY
jgi:hypothetical protein|tara:strand:- start:83 stop:532 length:450 start_codon:yes stop_codon:yes gene_type:complete